MKQNPLKKGGDWHVFPADGFLFLFISLSFPPTRSAEDEGRAPNILSGPPSRIWFVLPQAPRFNRLLEGRAYRSVCGSCLGTVKERIPGRNQRQVHAEGYL